MRNIGSNTHPWSESICLDDIPVILGTLYAACFYSSVAHGTIVGAFFALGNATEDAAPASQPAFDDPVKPGQVLMNLYGYYKVKDEWPVSDKATAW